jgi:Asp-tRNA(Asn)/Glu-tRNA(Gln) amidotransferase A subunit family amidase
LSELLTKSATELIRLIRARAVSPVQVVAAQLRRIEQFNPPLNAIVTLAPDALNQARAAESAVTRGDPLGPLHGLPVTIKDTIDTRGLRTTSGSRLRFGDLPSEDATVVAKLSAAGAIIIGKTNTSEMAIPYETNNPIFGRTNNPYDLERTAGGSSGGEAAAIAAALSFAGIGSDLSGSIRVPAHFCGITGLKPTTGRVSMKGHIPDATGRLALGACIGPMARSVDDLALLFEVIADDASGNDDAFELKGTRIAWYTDDQIAPVGEDIQRAVIAAAKVLQAAGLDPVEARPPGISAGSRLWIELFAIVAREQLRDFYCGSEGEAGPLVAAQLSEKQERAIDLSQKIAVAETAAKTIIERERFREGLLRWMKTTPLLLAPVGATVAFEHGSPRLDIDGQSISTFRAFSYSQTFNVVGFPSVVVPAGQNKDGLPIGVQIIGRPFAEKTILAAAKVVERELGGWRKPERF